jgi:hypothetical protein
MRPHDLARLRDSDGYPGCEDEPLDPALSIRWALEARDTNSGGGEAWQDDWFSYQGSFF